jgi:hypothetical protein
VSGVQIPPPLPTKTTDTSALLAFGPARFRAIFMLRVLQNKTKQFQRFAQIVGSSMQHARDMKWVRAAFLIWLRCVLIEANQKRSSTQLVSLCGGSVLPEPFAFSPRASLMRRHDTPGPSRALCANEAKRSWTGESSGKKQGNFVTRWLIPPGARSWRPGVRPGLMTCGCCPSRKVEAWAQKPSRPCPRRKQATRPTPDPSSGNGPSRR